MIDKAKLFEKDVLKTINKLVKNFSTLDSVSITKKSTSHYNFGVEEPSIKDRFDVQIDLGASKVIDCQVIFDSTDYNFPPDILFRKPFSVSDTFETNELSTLLPDTWDITNENCLRDWFSHLISLVKRPKSSSLSPPPDMALEKRPAFSDNYSSEKQPIIDDDYDDFAFEEEDKGKRKKDDNGLHKGKQKVDETRMFEETIIWKDREEKEDQKRKWDGLFEREENPKETIDIVDDDVFNLNTPLYKDKKPKRSDQSKEKNSKSYKVSEFVPPVKIRKLVHGSSTSKVDSNADYGSPVRKTEVSNKQSNPKNLEWRKEFMIAWLKKFQHHILQYDAEDSRSFSLYMTFDISEESPLWRKFNRLKHNKLVEFNAYNEKNVKLCKAKPYAPMICHFHMDADFPTSKLDIKLISVMNTIDVGSAEPDCLDVDYEVDLTRSMPFLIRDICKYLADRAIPFHLQMM